jgi:hypothetical protein
MLMKAADHGLIKGLMIDFRERGLSPFNMLMIQSFSLMWKTNNLKTLNFV